MTYSNNMQCQPWQNQPIISNVSPCRTREPDHCPFSCRGLALHGCTQCSTASAMTNNDSTNCAMTTYAFMRINNGPSCMHICPLCIISFSTYRHTAQGRFRRQRLYCSSNQLLGTYHAKRTMAREQIASGRGHLPLQSLHELLIAS